MHLSRDDSISSCSTRRSGKHLSMRRACEKDPCFPSSVRGHPWTVQVQTSGIPISHGTSPSGCLIGHFVATTESNGPASTGYSKTMLTGWRRYSQHPDPRVSRRFHRERLVYKHIMDASLRAMEYRLALEKQTVCSPAGEVAPAADQRRVRRNRTMDRRDCGSHPVRGQRSEQLRVARGWTYEPKARIEAAQLGNRTYRSLKRKMGRPEHEHVDREDLVEAAPKSGHDLRAEQSPPCRRSYNRNPRRPLWVCMTAGGRGGYG